MSDTLQLALTGDQKQLQELARDFVRKEVIPAAEHLDRSGEFPWDIFHKARAIGLANMNIPEEYGGVGASVLDEAIAAEEFAYGCSGIQTAVFLNQLGILPLLIAGNEAQKTNLSHAPHARRQNHVVRPHRA
jgi:acyl-CoA dehydrogenase